MTPPPAHDAAAIAERLKRGDDKFLGEVIASNGGGVCIDVIPAARLHRLEGIGLIRFKPNHPGYVIHTAATIALRASLAQSKGEE